MVEGREYAGVRARVDARQFHPCEEGGDLATATAVKDAAVVVVPIARIDAFVNPAGGKRPALRIVDGTVRPAQVLRQGAGDHAQEVEDAPVAGGAEEAQHRLTRVRADARCAVFVLRVGKDGAGRNHAEAPEFTFTGKRVRVGHDPCGELVGGGGGGLQPLCIGGGLPQPGVGFGERGG